MAGANRKLMPLTSLDDIKRNGTYQVVVAVMQAIERGELDDRFCCYDCKQQALNQLRILAIERRPQ